MQNDLNKQYQFISELKSYFTGEEVTRIDFEISEESIINDIASTVAAAKMFQLANEELTKLNEELRLQKMFLCDTIRECHASLIKRKLIHDADIFLRIVKKSEEA